jgi:hypothetical protein
MLANLMKLFRQLGFLQLALPGARRAVEDEGRVLDLFRNRAELKKAYSAAQDEILQLKDRLKQQEGATARVQELLRELEACLAAPESAYRAIVFYQLRELWSVGRAQLDEFVSELATQREEHERRQFLAEHNRRQFARRQSVEAALRNAESGALAVRNRATEVQARLDGLRRFWHCFQRRALRQELQEASVQTLLMERELAAARAASDALGNEAEPPFPGLSVAARRAINLAAVAYAQVLCERMQKTALMEPARAASAQREPAANAYGDRQACERLIADIQRARQLLQQRGTVRQEVSDYVEGFKGRARYRSDVDTLPTAESLAAPPRGTQALVDDSWEIHRLLLR